MNVGQSCIWRGGAGGGWEAVQGGRGGRRRPPPFRRKLKVHVIVVKVIVLKHGGCVPKTSRRAGGKSIINCSTASINYPLFLFVEHFFQQQVAPLKSVNESTIPREEFIWAKFECKDVSAERQNLSFKRLRKDFNFAWLCSRESVLLVTSQTIWMPAVLVENFTCLKTWKWEIFKLLFHLYQVSCSPDVVFKPSPFTSSHVLTSQGWLIWGEIGFVFSCSEIMTSHYLQCDQEWDQQPHLPLCRG